MRLASCFALVSAFMVVPVHAELYRDRYWPKPVTNWDAVRRMNESRSYHPDPQVMIQQQRNEQRLEELRTRDALERYKTDVGTRLDTEINIRARGR